MKLYEKLAEDIHQKIRSGFYQSGSRLPSIRQLSQKQGVSISTVIGAYGLLEQRASIFAKPNSGYYVAENKHHFQELTVHRPQLQAVTFARWEMVAELLHNHENLNGCALGNGSPDVSSSTLAPLSKCISTVNRRQDLHTINFNALLGVDDLRKQITLLMEYSGCSIHQDDIVLTTGCQEALQCCLRILTQPGDIIAIESPSFYGSMQFIQALGLRAIEIPAHPETGISLDTLEFALKLWDIKALLLTPTGSNPLGYIMPDAEKSRLLDIANKQDLPIIEDDIYGNLSYQQPRPRSLKSFDTAGRVLFCSSFSKTMSLTLRTGWCCPGRYLEQFKHMRYISTAGGPIIQQRAIAEFIRQGYYEKHVRKMRGQYLRNRDHMIKWCGEYFPEGTRMTYPQCGYLLWVEFPELVDTQQLNQNLKKHKVSVAPGILFTATEKYKNCIRLNYSLNNYEEIQNALRIIGKEAKQLI